MSSSRESILRDIFESMSSMRRTMRSSFSQAFDKLGLSPSQMQLLSIIHDKQPISHKALALKMQLSPGAISQLLDGLDQADCISRSPSQTDRRISYLSLTKTGKHKLQDFEKAKELTFTKAFATLSDSELENYLIIQRKLAEYFTGNSQNNQERIDQ